MPESATELGKSQGVRLADVLILGPFMLFLAMKGTMTQNERLFLGGIGAATIFYNLHHYRKIAEQTAQELALTSPAPITGARG